MNNTILFKKEKNPNSFPLGSSNTNMDGQLIGHGPARSSPIRSPWALSKPQEPSHAQTKVQRESIAQNKHMPTFL